MKQHGDSSLPAVILNGKLVHENLLVMLSLPNLNVLLKGLVGRDAQ